MIDKTETHSLKTEIDYMPKRYYPYMNDIILFPNSNDGVRTKYNFTYDNINGLQISNRVDNNPIRRNTR